MESQGHLGEAMALIMFVAQQILLHEVACVVVGKLHEVACVACVVVGKLPGPWWRLRT